MSPHADSGETKNGSQRQEVDRIVENNHVFHSNAFVFFAEFETRSSRFFPLDQRCSSGVVVSTVANASKIVTAVFLITTVRVNPLSMFLKYKYWFSPIIDTDFFPTISEILRGNDRTRRRLKPFVRTQRYDGESWLVGTSIKDAHINNIR